MNTSTNKIGVDRVITETTAPILNQNSSLIQKLQIQVNQIKGESILKAKLNIPEKNQVAGANFSRQEFGINQEGIYINIDNMLQLVADNNTPIPCGKGNFVFFDSFSVQDRNVAFKGFGSSLDQQGIYISCDGELQVIADCSTNVPNGRGNFIGFSLSDLGLDSNNVAFFAFSTQEEGIYLSGDGELQMVADSNTPIPGGTGNFTSFSDPGVKNGRVVFIGNGLNQQQGIYISTDNSLQKVVDTNTTVPGETIKFAKFNHITLDGNNLAFVGYVSMPDLIGTSYSPIGIYAYSDNSLTKVVDFSL